MLGVTDAGLLRADLTKGVNLFLGAGFSTLAGNITGNKLPVGEGLKDLLIREFDLSG